MELSLNFFSQYLQKMEIVEIFFDENIYKDESNNSGNYDVVYLLHGYQGDASDWKHRTGILEYIIGKRIICVAISGDNSFYLENVLGFNYEAFLLKEVNDRVRLMFPNIIQHQHIAGLSMGGYGALRLALLHPDLFETVGAFSTVADIFQLEKQKNLSQINLQMLLESNVDVDLFKIILKSKLITTRISLFCGLSDPYLEMSNRLFSELKEKGANITYKEIPGAHDWNVWDKCLKDFLAELN